MEALRGALERTLWKNVRDGESKVNLTEGLQWRDTGT